MAQGSHKLGKAKKSAGSQKRKSVKTVKKTKKGNGKMERNKSILATSKVINRKNERLIAAKAFNAGTTFALTDISKKGKLWRITFVPEDFGIPTTRPGTNDRFFK